MAWTALRALHSFFNPALGAQGTLLIPNIWAANRDPAVFEKGDEFVPERFIDGRTGQLKKDVSMPFGLGAYRRCSGSACRRRRRVWWRWRTHSLPSTLILCRKAAVRG